MGGTVAAGAAGAEALFQNPAALAGLEPEAPSEVAVGYDALLESAYQGAAAYARPLGREGAIGAGLVYASQSPQTAYSGTGDSAGTFTPLDFALGAGYARRVGPVMLGGGLKVLRSSLSDRSAATAAVDFGVVARHVSDLGEGPLDLGASVTNLGPGLKLGSTADPLPLRARLGAGWRVTPTFDADLDLVFPVDQDPYATLGLEARFPFNAGGKAWTASLRGGYDQNGSRNVDGFSGASFGGGLDLAAMRVDYAWIALGSLGSANRITLAFRF